MARLLATIDIAPDAFAAKWEELEWYKDTTQVGVISQKADAAEAMTGRPTSTRSNNSKVRQTMKLASFVFEVQILLEKQFADVFWCGHSVLIEQFLVVAQMAIKLHSREAWVRPAAPVIMTLAGHLAAISYSASSLSALDFAALRASTREYSLIIDEKRSIKMETRGYFRLAPYR